MREPVTVGATVESAARRWGDKTLISTAEQTASFAAIDADATRFACALRSVGVGKGDAVAVMLSNRVEFVVAWFGSARIGAVEVSINSAFKGDVLRYVLATSRARVLVCEAEYVPVVAAVRASLPSLKHLIVVGDPPADRLPAHAVGWADFNACGTAVSLGGIEPVRASDVAHIAFTSGTTCRSRGALLPHGRVTQTAVDMIEVRGVDEHDTLYTCLPLFHGNAKYLTVMLGLLSGAEVALGRRFSASGFWRDIRSSGATQFNYLGVMVAILNKQPASPDDRAHTARLAWGAGASQAAADLFQRRFGTVLLEGYGQTETGVPVSNTLSARKRGACGRPLRGFDVAVVDEADDPLPAGSVGEIVVRPTRPYTTMLGYHEMPRETLRKIRNLWIHTGDLGRFDDDGFLWFAGRRDEAIRRRGENISAYEVEHLVERHPDVLECAAIGVPSEVTEDDVLLVASTKPNAELTVEALAAYCEDVMPSFWQPRYIRLTTDPLPRTPTNKLQKGALRTQGVAGAWDRLAPVA